LLSALINKCVHHTIEHDVTNHHWGLRLGHGRRHVTENPMACDEVTWRSRDGSWGIRLRRIGIHGIQGSSGVQYGTKDYIGELCSQADRSFVLNSNSISYILVTAQYFRASLGDTHRTYHGSLPKTPQPPNVLKLASITTDCERYTWLLPSQWELMIYHLLACLRREFF